MTVAQAVQSSLSRAHYYPRLPVYDIGVRFVGIWEKLQRKANQTGGAEKIADSGMKLLIYPAQGL
jgi:hypothetical protein